MSHPVETIEITHPPERKALLRRFLQFMLPVLAGTVMQSASGTVGSVYVGHLLGADALGAAISFYPIVLIVISCAVGLGSGASVLVGQSWGAGNLARGKRIAGTALSVNIATGIVIGGLGVAALPFILRLFGTPANILPAAQTYTRVMLIGTPALMVSAFAGIVLRGANDAIRPLVLLVVEIIVALILSPILIAGGSGVPPIGLAGAAWAAVLGWTLAVVIVGIWLVRLRHPLAPDAEMFRFMRPDPAILVPVLRIGLPAMIEITTMGFAEMALIRRINGFGSAMTASYGIFTQVLTYIEFPGMAVGITVSVLCSHAIGARDIPNMRAVLRIGFMVALGVTGALAALVSACAPAVCHIFTNDPAVIPLAVHALRVTMWSAIPLSLAGVIGAAMRASGDVMMPMVLLLLAIIGVEIPVGYVCSRVFGASGVWYGYPSGFSAMLLLMIGYYVFVWRHRRIEPLLD